MESDERAIREFQADWFEATAEGDVDRLRSLMAEDVVFLTAGQPPFGREALLEAVAARPPGVRIDAAGEFEEIVVVGDVAYARGRLSVSLTTDTGEEVRRMGGYALSVFRRLTDGRWVLARDANLLASES